jgi:hypothetical protein
LTSAGAGAAVGELGGALGEGLGWLAGALGSAVSVIGGILVPNTSMATLDQDSPGFTFYHGTGSFSGGLLDAGAAANNDNGYGSAAGFYLATDPATAVHFAAVAGQQAGNTPAVLTYQINSSAMVGLQAAGSTFGPVPGGPTNSTSFPGYQLFVPATAFPAFNSFLQSGGIRLTGVNY